MLLKSDAGHVLVDTGYVRHAPLTLALVASARGIGDAPLAAIVNTHCHSDHIGGNAALAAKYRCPVYVPEGEAPHVRAWDERALWLDWAGQRADRFTPAGEIRPGERHVWGDLEWLAIAAPGHDMGALCFFDAEHGVLLSGDALWQHGFGLVMPPEIEPGALAATRATLDTLARLDVRTVIPGHGEPFADFPAALERAYRRVEAFEADPARLARHALKVMLTFTLLDRQRMTLAELPGLLDRTGMYREFNDLYFRWPSADLAAFLVDALLRAGAVRCADGILLPAGTPEAG